MSTPSRYRYDDTKRAAVIADYCDGLPIKDIAEIHHVTRETVRLWARRAGVSRPGTAAYYGRCTACCAPRALPSGLCRPCADEIPLRGGRWVPRGGIVVWREAS